MANEFYALMSRMRNITRWSLMRNTFSENIQEHSHQVAMLAHALALIRKEILHLDGPDPDKCAVAALYHDATETLTGDMPTPIKYYNPEIRIAYKQVEKIAGQRLIAMLPEQLQAHYAPVIMESDPQIAGIVKAADKLSAYIKCIEEQKAGNTEFDSAADATRKALQALKMPELDWFLENCLEPFARNLDQLR